MDIFFLIVQKTLAIMIPLLIVALGALICEKSGIVNIALEGIMIMGALVGMFFVAYAEKHFSLQPQLLMLIAILIGGVAGGLFSLFHAFASINLKANQTISGTALNIFAPAFGAVVARSSIGVSQIDYTTVFMISKIPFLGDIPIIGPMLFQNTYISLYIGIIVLLSVYFVLKKTRIGLRIRACGENPQAADSAGINITKIRYIGVLTSGVLAGMGGVIYVTISSSNFNHSVSGYGFLALAVLIFGNWKPMRILFASSFFALMSVLRSVYAVVPFLSVLGLPSQIYEMIPYVATLIVLALTSKVSNSPKASGEIYDKGKR